MADTFPGGHGVDQGAGAGQVTLKTPFHAIVDNEPETDGPSDYPRAEPADPGGTNTAGWMKTSDYGNGYYSLDGPGPWRQV